MLSEPLSDRVQWPDLESGVEARALGERLHDLLIDTIDASGGTIGFDEFMQMALYAPGLGYYMAGQARFGEQGDFITAPELSPIFAQCLALQLRDILNGLDDGRVLEFGAGSGKLALGLLEELSSLNALPQAYLILEPSADLRAQQKRLLRDFSGLVHWLEYLPKPGFQGIVLANEVIDAMPVRRFVLGQRRRVMEQAVGHRSGKLTWVERPADPALADAVGRIEHVLGARFSAGFASEVNLTIEPWCRALQEFVTRGAVLICDYGYTRREYYHPERRDGTLICHYRHRAHADPFFRPGLQDISSFVDFSAMADAAAASNFHILGYANQANFLIGCGLDEVLSRYQQKPLREYLDASAQVKKLTLPGEMGERFKVLAFAKGIDDTRLRGFGFSNHRVRL